MLCAIICISFIVILYLVVDRRRLRIQCAQAEKQLLKRNYFSVVLSLEVEQAKSRMAKRELDMVMHEKHEDIAEIADLTTRIDKTDNVLQKMDGILKSTMLIIGEMKAETEIQSSTPGKKA
ncbi:hypothetical protein LPJ81_005736 [Coemansia sp. IMI 209127]|nr:hypothetical protein LPJ81_005736 [Coemansia sp. IMI 209127]